MNQDRPPGGSAPSPFGSMADESPFGLAASEAASVPAQMPPPPQDGSSEVPRNPFHSKSAKSAVSAPEAPPFEATKVDEGGFEMKGISASEAPVGNIDTAPLGRESAAVSPFAGGGAETSNEATNPFGGAKEAFGVDKDPATPVDDFGAMPERNAAPVFPTAVAAPVASEPVRAAAAPAVAPPPVSAPAEAPPAPAPVAAAPAIPSSAPPSPIDSIKQLEVRAIFGVDRELSRSELIQRAKTLPGIKNLSSVSGEEVVAMETVQSCMANLGFGRTDNILLTCPNGLIEFVSQGTSTIAVVRDGGWKPGVRETLIIIARELDKL